MGLVFDTNYLIAVLLIIVAVLAIGGLLNAFYEFDRIVRIEYEFHRSVWEKDGSPQRLFYPRFKVDSNFKTGLATNRVMSVWVFNTPLWARTSPDLLRRFRRYRICVLLWNAVCIFAFFCLVFDFPLRIE
jgi:hypothetical protein